MRFYTYAKCYGNHILFRGYDNGHQIIEKVKFKPTLYIPSTSSTVREESWHSLYDNKPLDSVKFDSIRDAKNFVEQYKDVSGISVHGFQKWDYQFINNEYPDEIEYDVSMVNILTLDIEVVSDEEDGFPDIQAATFPIVLISLHSSTSDKTIVLGLKDYELDVDDDFEYKQFPDELSMLKYFIAYNQVTKPDIWTGWNTSQFDIPYIVNRIFRLFGEDMVKRLSPFNIVNEKITNIRGKDVQTYDIYGIVDLDYLELYKKYGTRSKKESYALAFIAQDELGETKLELPGTSFRDSYNNHFRTFVKYNAVDTVLVKKLERKMKLIELAFAMTFMYRCNIQDIYRTVLPWEIFIFNHLSSKKIAVPPRKDGMQMKYEGAWVKEPKPGMYGWLMSFDFTGLYPAIIMQWNISPENFREARYTSSNSVSDFLDENPNADNNAVNARKYAVEAGCSIAANYTMYDLSKQGFLSELMEYCVVGRKVAKTEMLSLEVKYQETKNEALTPKIAALHNKQLALKLAANAGYGAIGNVGFHYYDYRIAEAITLSGQLSDIHLANTLNNKFNSLMKTENVDYIVYGDTDSIYLNCQPIVDKYANGKSRDQIVEFLDKLGTDICQPEVSNSTRHIYENMNCKKLIMSSKREAIASKALFRAKKNYAMYIHNSEGVKYDPPYIKVLGIEIVKSSTPQWCRSELKNSLVMLFEKEEEDFRKHFSEVEHTFLELPPEVIAFPRGVNEIEKWIEGRGVKSRCPIHVRASIMYNNAIEKYPSYQKIQNGDKIKFLYLKMPNPIGANVIGFHTSAKLPPELGLEKYVDRALQFEKTFESPMKSLTDCANWHLREQSTLLSFFTE